MEAALDYCRKADVLVAWRIKRLECSVKIIELDSGLKERVGFRSL